MERDEGHGPSAKTLLAGGTARFDLREPSGELLGPYILLTELARGELTTVHLAKKQGPLGFQRLVAVKRLRSEYAGQESCVKLLVDEARFTAGLHHANLVGVLDVGSEGGCYVVSDYIEGENLERVLVRAGAAGHPRFVLPVLVDALNGLHAVHNALGEDEQPLHIVHQAPCARHIVIGLDGVGRLTDFSQMSARGIAPSRVRSERLRVAYMAPEQALDPERVDHRADLFIVGIALWEALTGENLFAADSDERTFQNLLHRRIPRPSEVGMCPPRSFDAVCMRALERDPEARFGSALEMARELRDVALNQALYALPGEIGAWVKGVMGRELGERRRKLGDMSSQEIALAGVTKGGSRADASVSTSSGPRRSRVEDPYLSGRIYGGSQPMALEDDGLASDPDKTPVRGLRDRVSVPALAPARELEGGLRKGLFPIQRDEEPTAPRYLAFHSLNEVPRPPRRTRISTPPYGTFSDSVVAPLPLESGDASASVRERNQDSSSVVEKPRPSADAQAAALADSAADVDTERTLPNRVSTPPAPRAASPARPGAYSHVAPSHRNRTSRPSAPAPREASVLPPPAASAVSASAFEERQTGRHLGLPSLAPGAIEHAGPRSGGAKSSLPPPLPRKSTPALETRPAQLGPRRDSAPTRFSIPPEPVGKPMATPAPLGVERLPKTFEALRTSVDVADELAMPHMNPSVPSSLTPPNTAERTLPPTARLDDARPRGKGFWGVSSLLAAIILLAAGVGLRQWAGGGEPTAAASSGGRDVSPEIVTPDAPGQAATAAPTVPEAAESRTARVIAQPSPVREEQPIEASTGASTGGGAAKRAAAHRASAPAAAAAAGAKEPVFEAGAVAREQKEAGAVTREQRKASREARAKDSAEETAQVTNKPRPIAKSAIPDNPY